MSAQSILNKSIKSIKREAEDILLENANKYTLKNSYLLGKGHCADRTKHSLRILNLLDTENCDLISFINDKIEGKEEDSIIGCTYNNEHSEGYKSNNKVSEKQEDTLYRIWLSRGNSGTIEDFLELLLKDEDVQLLQNNW